MIQPAHIVAQIEGAAAHELDLIGADPAGQKVGTAGGVREDADVVGNVLRKRAGSIGYFAWQGWLFS